MGSGFWYRGLPLDSKTETPRPRVRNVTIDGVREAVAIHAERVSYTKSLAGFFLSGFLFALPGALLPAWGYHRDPPEFVAIGNCFLAVAAGVLLSGDAARRLLARTGVPTVLVLGSTLACFSLLGLALFPPPAPIAWRLAGLFLAGLATRLVNTGLFHALGGLYRSDPAGTAIKCGALFGLGSLAATLMVAEVFYAYTVSSIVILMATVPGFFAGIYANARIPDQAAPPLPKIRRVLRDFRSPRAVMFALLLFFQFGNEWSLAGWLPLFLVRRLGVSPKNALLLLALYWLALLTFRLVAILLVHRVRHGRLLGGSILAALFGFFLLYFTDNAFGAATGTVLVGCGFATLYPLLVEKVGRSFPYYNPAFFNGIFSFAITGGLLAPATLGYFASVAGIGVVMALPLAGTCMVIFLLLLIWLQAKVTGQ